MRTDLVERIPERRANLSPALLISLGASRSAVVISTPKGAQPFLLIQLHDHSILVGNRDLEAMLLEGQVLSRMEIRGAHELRRKHNTLRLIFGGVIDDQEQACSGAGNKSRP